MKTAQEWNTRFVAYAATLGQTAGEAEKTFKGFEFIIWVRRQWLDWCKEFKKDPNASRTTDDHAHFDAWLDAKVSA